MARLTLRRFEALARSYGSDLRRWPEHERAAAEALSGSPEAQAILNREQRLDEALAGRAQAGLWSQVEQNAALARTRARVNERIAAAVNRRRTGRAFGAQLPASGAIQLLDMARMRLALGAGLAVTSGLLIGVISAPAAPDHVLTLLQSAPIFFLTD